MGGQKIKETGRENIKHRIIDRVKDKKGEGRMDRWYVDRVGERRKKIRRSEIYGSTLMG